MFYFPEASDSSVRRAMDIISAQTCIEFVEVTADATSVLTVYDSAAAAAAVPLELHPIPLGYRTEQK